MTTAASAGCGRSFRSDGRNSNRIATVAAPARPVTCDLEPASSATAVRDALAEIANPWNMPATALAAPIPIISWFGSTSSPRRAAKLVEVAIVSVRDTRTIPIDAMNSGPRCSNGTPGNVGVGNPLGNDPTVATPLAARSKTPVTTVAPTTATSTAGTFFDTRGKTSRMTRVAETDQQGRRVRLVETRDESFRLVDEAIGVRRKAEQFGQLPNEDGDREAIHVADLDLFGQQVRDEPEFAETESDFDRADHQRHHPGERDRGRRIAGHEQRRDGREDQRRHRGIRPEHEDARRTEACVPNEAGDRRIEAGHGWQPRELGVRHTLRHEDRREDQAGDEIRPQPGGVVRPEHPNSRGETLENRPSFVLSIGIHAHPPVGRHDSVSRCRVASSS